MPILLLLVIVAMGLLPVPAGAQQATVTDALSEWFVRTLPLPSASAGVSYSFDPATGNFRREPATFGQIYLERADPLGARHFNLSLAYHYAELDEIEGMDAGNLTDPLPIPIEGVFAALHIPVLRVGLAVHSFLFAATYGVTDDFDLSLAVPVMMTDLDLEAEGIAAALTEEGTFRFLHDQVKDSSLLGGIGDVLLRAKYRVLELDDLHAAAGLLLRLPSGDKEDFQGTGFVEVAPSLLASTRIFEPASWARLQGHVNGTVGFNAENVDSSDARWGIGLDWGLTEDITAAVAFLGRYPFSRIVPADSLVVPRCSSDVIACAIDPSQRDTSAPLFGLSGDRTNYYTASIGGRASLWRDTFFGFVNVAVPLNDGFVRTKPIPMVGIEATL